MNAISIQQPDAAALLEGREPVNYFAWRTDHRGPLLIHAAKGHPARGLPGPASDLAYNAVIGAVDLQDCVPDDHPGADPDEVVYRWVLTNLRVFAHPLPVNGKVGLFQVSDKSVAPELSRAEARKRRAARRETKKRPAGTRLGGENMQEFARLSGESPRSWLTRLTSRDVEGLSVAERRALAGYLAEARRLLQDEQLRVKWGRSSR